MKKPSRLQPYLSEMKLLGIQGPFLLNLSKACSSLQPDVLARREAVLEAVQSFLLECENQDVDPLMVVISALKLFQDRKSK